jgi:hypothetical protein
MFDIISASNGMHFVEGALGQELDFADRVLVNVELSSRDLCNDLDIRVKSPRWF